MTKIADLAQRIAQHDPQVTSHYGLLVVDTAGKLEGIITRGDIVRAMGQDPTGEMAVIAAATKNPVVAYPDEVLYDAAAKMLRQGVGRLPVVSREDPRQPVGYLGRSQIMAARLRRLEEEHVREPGWLGRLSSLRKTS